MKLKIRKKADLYYRLYQCKILVESTCLFFLFFSFFTLILASIYLMHPKMAEFSAVFSFLLFLIFFLCVFLTTNNLRKMETFSKWIYLNEENNLHIQGNPLSALFSTKENDSFLFADLLEEAQKALMFFTYPWKTHYFLFLSLFLLLLFWNFPFLFADQKTAIKEIFGQNQVSISLKADQPWGLQNSPIKLSGKILGKPLHPLEIIIHTNKENKPQSVLVTSMISHSETEFSFFVSLPGYEEDITIMAKSGSHQSFIHEIQIVKEAAITQIQTTISFPQWTKKPPLLFTSFPETVKEGCQVETTFLFSKPLKAAKILTQHPVSVVHQSDRLLLSFLVSSSINFTIEATDIHNFPFRSKTFRTEKVPDLPPFVQIDSPEENWQVPAGIFQKLPLTYRAFDDDKLLSVQLNLRTRQQFETTWLQNTQQTQLTPSSNAQQTTTIEMQPLFLQAGDRIFFHIEARDQNPSHPPSFSATHTILVPWSHELAEEFSQQTEEITKDLEEVLKEEKSVQKSIEELSRAMENKKEVDVSDKKQLKEILDKKEEIQKEMAEIEENISQLLEEERSSELLDAGMLSKMDEIRELAMEISDQMQLNQSKMNTLGENFDRISPQKMQEMLKNFNKDEFSRDLERTLESLKKIKDQKEFLAKQQKLEKMADQMENFSKLASEGKFPDESDFLSLKKEIETLEEELKKLSKSEHLSENLKISLDESAKSLNELQKDISEALTDLKKKQSENFSQKTASVSRKMKTISKNMKESLKEEAKQILSVNMQRLQFFLKTLQSHSKELLNLSQELKFLHSFEKTRTAATRLSWLLFASETLNQDILLEYRQNLQMQEILFEIIQTMITELKTSISEWSSDQPPFDDRRQKNIYSMNNQLILVLLSLLEKLQNQEENMQMQDFMDSLEEITQKQQKINRETKAMQEQSGARKQWQMQKLAFEQSLVRQSTQKLYEKYQKRVELASQMQEISKEMSDVEKKLSDGNSSESTQKQQQKIEYRLLETQNAVKEQKESQKRQSESVKTLEISQSGTSETKKENSLIHSYDKMPIPESMKQLILEWTLWNDKP